MSRKLDILIPHYHEEFDVVKTLLDSIEIQQNVDLKNEVGVIIVNDGDDVVFDKELFSKYTFPIEYYIAEHKGVSATRNACLDHSNAEYVEWCDADDCFATINALWFLFREMKLGEFDTLTSVFYEESVHPETKEHFYITRGDAQTGIDTTFVHGKVHRRQYLINNNIRWNENLFIHEDSYFNCLCQRCADPSRVKYCPYPFYLWRWRDESVCRRDPKYILKTMPDMVKSNTALVESLLSRAKNDDAKFYATSMIMDCYYSINCKQWMADENLEFKCTLERCFKEYYNKYKHLFEGINEQVKAQIIMSVRNRFFQEGLVLESITFEDWIKCIETM